MAWADGLFAAGREHSADVIGSNALQELQASGRGAQLKAAGSGQAVGERILCSQNQGRLP